MLFSSLTFLYAFLPLSLILYVRGHNIQQKNIILLVSSLVFYAWGEPKYVLLLLFMSIADWFIARCIDWAKNERARKLWLIGAVVLNLALIGFFKYSGLIASVFGAVPAFIENIALPLGISFYTFQLISYVVDVYRGDVAARENPLDVLLYASLFHQCIAGPIVRYNTIETELFVERHARPTITEGVQRFSWGLGKKVILANACSEVADKLLLSDADIAGGLALADGISQLAAAPVAGLWIGMLAYMLRIYLDFSAYSDMAIGLGLMLGLHYPENFDHPYMSKSVSEFWRRWHISLGAFFRDYVYIPLGGSRCSARRSVVNLLTVWLLTGLWHGANWTFVLWGLWFGALLLGERWLWGGVLERAPRVLRHAYTLLAVMLSWVLFRANDLGYALGYLHAMLGGGSGAGRLGIYSILEFWPEWIVGIAAAYPWKRVLAARLTARGDRLSRAVLTAVPAFLALGLLGLSYIKLVAGSFNPFIYFQF